MKKSIIFFSTGLIVVLGAYFFYQKFYKDAPDDDLPLSNNNQNQQQSGSGLEAQNPNPGISVQNTPYRDGSYVGPVVDAFFGPIQVKAVISGGKIIDVQYLQYPNKPGHTIEVSNEVMPILKSEVIKTQSAKLDNISGATQTVEGFIRTLSDALAQAKV